MRDKEIKVTLQRCRAIFVGTQGELPERYFVKRIQNSLFVKTEIGADGKRRGSMRDPELRFFAGDCISVRQAEDIAHGYESTVLSPESE